MWPTKRRRREERYLRWKFRGPPDGPVPGLLLAVSGDEVLGQLGLIPAEIMVAGERLSCQWACDLMVDSSLRRRGVGSALFREALGRGVVTIGSNPSAAADVTMRRSGFVTLTGPSIAVFPLDPTHITRWRVPAGAARVVGTALRPFFRWRGRALHAKADALPPVAQGDWRSVADRVQAAQSRQPGPFIVHDQTFLAWRCAGLSGFSEPLLALRTATETYAIVGPANPYFYVYDWHASSWHEFLALFNEIRRLAAVAHAMTIEAYAQGEEERGWLRAAGFLMLRTPCGILWHPASRLPVALERIRYSIFDSDGNL
jgi:hypothetical protein